MNQQQSILKYLKSHKKKGITSKEAIDLFGCTRLSAQIAALEHKGHRFDHIRETVQTRYGSTSIVRYILRQD